MTTTLGDEPISSDSPVGVIICPPTTLGAAPTNVSVPTLGTTPLIKEGANPSISTEPASGLLKAPINELGAIPSNNNVAVLGVISTPTSTVGAIPVIATAPTAGVINVSLNKL